MRPMTPSREEIAARGRKLYEEKIRAQIEATHQGEFLVIDIDSGDFEVDPKDVELSIRLRVRRPEAVTYGLRIGFPTAYRLGGRFRVQ